MKLFAFWRYPSCIDCLGAPVVKMREDGSILAEGYGPGGWFKPFKILPLGAGQALWYKLQAIEIQYKEKQKNLLDEYRAEARKILPELDDGRGVDRHRVGNARSPSTWWGGQR